MTVHCFTIQNSKWRLARNRDIVMMDTSVKTGFSIFAPTWSMVMDHKRGEISDDEYTAMYRARMNASFKAERGKWMQTIQMTEPVALGCFCKPGDFCHRILLKDMLEKLCAREGIEFLYYGELTE
jgi:uncharacterized protein YeaO (DUF488 family)